MGASKSSNYKIKEASDNSRIQERNTGHAIKINVNDIYKISKSICQISYLENNKPVYGTGFFMVLNNNKYIITNYHVISESLINIKFFEELDITIIEIKEIDNIIKDIEFLDYDLNYIKGYKQYLNKDIFSLQYPKNGIVHGSGKIIEINEYEFTHTIDTENGSSGSPIILPLSLKVIGIHKQGDKYKNVNYGSFIGEIINGINNLNNYKNDNNCIISEINIRKEDIGKQIRIINSYEEYFRNLDYSEEFRDEYKNEEEIKECKIAINNEEISFCYFYKCIKEGKYQIKYSFNNYLTNTNHMFCDCESLININLSNFNTKNVTNMERMFCFCKSLTNINLSNFNTQNVTNMGFMFCFCKSLTNINLSNFNTQNVTDMSFMFNRCTSLTNIDLSNFNTQNVTNMEGMFKECISLTNINLSNFNTKNVTNMGWMFCFCESLTNINLSNFNTQNVTDMGLMFNHCESLTNIDLSNFNTQNVINMNDMFSSCKSLININLSNFNTQNVTHMCSMFGSCQSLTNINLSNFNTQNVTDMSCMFCNCNSLININLSNFNTQNVTDMSYMFSDCYYLTNINLSNFNTQNVITDGMFENCKSLKKEKVIIKDIKILDQLKEDLIY